MKLFKHLLLIFAAIPLFSAAQNIELINSGEVIKKGTVLYDSAKYKPAIVLFNKVNRSDTNYVWSLYEKALACEADSQYNQAIKCCQEALALKEDREYEPDLYNTYGNTLSDMGKREEAIKVFDIAIKKYPLYALLYFNKGVVYLALNRNADAEEWFKKSLLINPYMYSAHYQLGLAALRQGKIVPAFLSLTGYLLMNPTGRYWSKSINLLNQISKSTDDVLDFKNKRTITPDANYQAVEEILLSKIALDKQYKPIISLDDPISRQIQAVFEKLEYSDKDPDFWVQYYLPYYKHVYKDGRFEEFVYHSFMNVDIPVIQAYVKKNKKALDGFETDAGNYFNLIRSTKGLYYSKRDAITEKYVYENGKLIGKGLLLNGKTLNGKWEFYHSVGNIKAAGEYNATGKREGDWIHYYFSGQLKAKEHYRNGDLEGPQTYYFENGNLSAQENYVNGQAEGLITTYYNSGNKKSLLTYKAGKKDGTEKAYYGNGNLRTINNYTAGVLTGATKEFYKSGPIKEDCQYINGKLEGPYKFYYEGGAVSAEMTFAKDNVTGEWKSYYENGKLKAKRNYVNSKEEGLHQEFYDNGQPSETYNTQKGKVVGELVYNTRDGKVYGKSNYDNGVLKSVQYLDAAGKQLSASAMRGNMIDVTTYTAEGLKKTHYTADQKGNINGPDTIFYASGKVYQVNEYKNDDFNGSSVSYFLNGKKKSESTMTDGKENGYYKSYYTNGKPESEGWMQDGNNQGQWVYYDNDGKLSSKIYYLDSEINGYKEEYDPNGNKTTEQKYHNGLLEKMTQYDAAGKVIAIDSFAKGSGKYTLLYPKGQVMAQTNYVNGNFNGAYKSFYFDGSVESSFFYKNGLLDSTYVNYYYGGIKHQAGSYKQGNKIGTWNTYEEDGVLKYTIAYAKDLITNEHIYYHTNGAKDYVATYKNDMLEGATQKYDPDGALAYQVVFEADKAKSYAYMDKDGKLLPFTPIPANNGVFKAYFANGKVSRECIYSDGEKNGEMKIYYTNGQLRSVDHTAYGVNEGSSKDFYPDGKLSSEYVYANDNLHGPAKEYYKSGILKKEETFVNGANHGEAKYYDEKGKLFKTLLYDYGKLISVKNEK